MIAQIQIGILHLPAAASDGRWMGSDYVLSLLLGTFPAWAMYTVVRGWVRPAIAGCGLKPGSAPAAREE